MINRDGKAILLGSKKLQGLFAREGGEAVRNLLLQWYTAYIAQNPHSMPYTEHLKYARIFTPRWTD